jgi:hypothetical protein
MHGLLNKLRANMVRVDTDFSATPFKAKISNAEQLRVHPADAGLVIGGRDPAVRDRRGQRPSPRQRQHRRKTEGESGGGYFIGDSGAAGVSRQQNLSVTFSVQCRLFM